MKNNFEKYTELIAKADANGYDFIKFKSELDKAPDENEKVKKPTKKRNKK